MHVSSHKMQTQGFLSNVSTVKILGLYIVMDLSLRGGYEGREDSVYNMMMGGKRERLNSFA